MKMRLAELISVATRKTGKPLRWEVDFELGLLFSLCIMRMSLLINA